MRVLPILLLVACSSSSNVTTLEHTPKTFSGSPLRVGPARKGPYLNAEGDERGIDVRVRLDQLPEDITAYVLRIRSWDDKDAAGSLVTMGCDEGRTLRVLGRDAFAFREGDDAWLALHLEPPEIERGKAYAVVGCLKSKENVLHPGGEHNGNVVAMTSTPTHLGILSTPSGAIAWEAVEKGHELVGYDADSNRRVVTEVLALHERTLPAVDIALDDGRILQAPRSQEYWQPATRSYRPASALAAGDELLSHEGRARVLRVEETDMRTFGVLDVSSPDTYFRDGLLVRDAKKSTSATAQAYRPPRAGSVTLTAAPLSYDCYLTARLSIAALPEHAQSIAIIATPQHDHRGTHRSMACNAGAIVQEVPRRNLEAVLESGSSTIELWLNRDPIDCDGSYALLACARTDRDLVPLGSAVYGKAGSSCFAAGTPITTPTGEVPIETLEPGDDVRAYDTSRHTFVTARVLRITTREARSLLRLTTAHGTALLVTPEHPFYVPLRGWVEAKNLEIGTPLLATKLVDVMPIEKRTTVYNLTVSAPHTYFAGGALVHNY